MIWEDAGMAPRDFAGISPMAKSGTEPE
jgi:hypothetical protein